MQVFCDGAFSKKPQGAGVGVTFSYNGEQFDFSLSVKETDSNLVELKACRCALESLLKVVGLSEAKTLCVSLYSDSDYVERQQKENTNEWCREVYWLFSYFESVSLVVVKGHSGARSWLGLMNEHVDRLAKKAMREEIAKR